MCVCCGIPGSGALVFRVTRDRASPSGGRVVLKQYEPNLPAALMFPQNNLQRKMGFLGTKFLPSAAFVRIGFVLCRATVEGERSATSGGNH